jgi:hypothetical protein
MLLAIIVFIVACGEKKNATDWRMQLRINEKQPYDLFLSYKHLKDIFPKAKITERYKIFAEHMSYVFIEPSDTIELKIITGNTIEFSSDELVALRRFVQAGNYVLIAASAIDGDFKEQLGVQTLSTVKTSMYMPGYSETSDIPGLEDTVRTKLFLRNLPNAPKKQDSFIYTGAAFNNYLSIDNDDIEGSQTNISKQDFLSDEYGYVLASQVYDGAGKFVFVSSPLPFTNHFLLNDGGQKFSSKLLSVFSEDIQKVTWHSYKIRTAASENGSASDNPLAKLMKYPMWKRAIILAIIGLFLYALILARRKQRSVPVVPPVKNDSLEFAESVGHLYFNKGDNKNICIKMAMHFLDYLKTKYNLPFLKYDSEFVQRVSAKSGQTQERVQQIFTAILLAHNNAIISDQEVADLYNLIQDFKTNK